MGDTIRIIACRVGEEPTVEQIARGHLPMQAFVGGYFQAVPVEAHDDGGGVDVVSLEDAEGARFNRKVEGLTVWGPFFLNGFDSEGEGRSLTDAEIESWMPRLALAERRVANA